jgi:hypothetical protein
VSKLFSLATIMSICLRSISLSHSRASVTVCDCYGGVDPANSLPLIDCFLRACFLLHGLALGPGSSCAGAAGAVGCCLSAAMSTCRSTTACTILAGLADSGSRFAMLSILLFRTCTVFDTLHISLNVSSLGGNAGMLFFGCFYSRTFFSYAATASYILVSTFLSTISSLTPSVACKVDSVKSTACWGPCCCPLSDLSWFRAVVSLATCASAASRRVVSCATSDGMGAEVADCGGGTVFISFAILARRLS